ncbi:MAG TPA: PD-(D/E)XK nuclease family protein [Kiritimatiellia bacterium]|nr:PD-(D/E)XK nuclease family protein [Kiritimatiellia bacterium]
MALNLHFCGRKRPALDLAADFLLRDWKSGPIDLRDALVIVPTRNAGRRLRERLALLAAERGTAVLTGIVETPSRLFAPDKTALPVVSDVMAEAFWRKTLDAFDPRKLERLSRSGLAQNPAARAAAAEHLVRLRSELCEENYDLTSFAAQTAAEKERWACLAELEEACRALLQKNGWNDDVTAKLEAAAKAEVPENIKRVIVLFVPDPPPLSLRVLQKISTSLSVDVCVHAAPAEKNDFDSWGRPLPGKWLRRELSLDPSQIEVCDDAEAMAELVSRHIAGLPEQARAGVTVGVGDARSAVRIADELGRRGIPVFDPSDRPAARLPMFLLISRLVQVQKDLRYLSFMTLARHPDALRRLETAASAPDTLLAELDDFQNRHMPSGMPDALLIAQKTGAVHVVSALEEAQRWLDLLGGGPLLSESLRLVLKHVYQDVPEADECLAEAVSALHQMLEKLACTESIGISREDAADLFLRMVDSTGLSPDRPEKAIELLGWLELAWEDAPVLLLTDLNDGKIPETRTADPFLPDGARRAAGLRDNAHRLARDAHILESVLCFTGRRNLRGFMPRRSPDGDPLKPSRLLLQCGPDELARRAGQFFSDAGSPFASLARSPGWRIRLPALRKEIPLRHVSPSALRLYLDCPFRYYLKKILGLAEPYEEQAELDALGFGTLCHDVFQCFANAPLKNSGDENKIAAFLKEKTDELFERKFGANLSLPLMIQRDVIRQRMTAAAGVQARLRREGWQIAAAEQEFRCAIAGVPLVGRIDRIDQNEKDGRVRVIDYKTTASAKNPEQTHITRSAKCESYKLCADGKSHWSDLQLPLYVHAWRTMNPGGAENVEAAYFALPNAAGSTSLLIWENMDAGRVGDALQCAERIIRRIRAGVFWPPQPGAGPREDPLDRLFFQDIETLLDPRSREELQRRAEAFNAGGES